VCTAVHEGVGEAQGLLRAAAESTPSGTPCFPLLSGPEVAPAWVRVLAYPGRARINGLERLPVAVDVQVRKVAEDLGMTRTQELSLEDLRPVIQRAWQEDVQAHGAEGPSGLATTSAALDPVLSFFGKWGCTRCERARVPSRL
jgi:hypothetical protein